MIYGHKKQFHHLISLINSNSLPHCMIFSGQESIGKKLVAQELSKYFFCKDKNACNECHNCSLLNEGNFPDLVHVDSEAIDTESFKEIIRDWQLKPFSQIGRFIIIDNAEMLNNTIYNSLLKTLEEPSLGNYFFLVTSSIGKLPFTIHSRSQILNFNKLSQIEIANFISDNPLAANISSLKNFADNSPGKVLWISENIEQITKMISYIESGSSSSFIKLADLLIEEKDDLKKYLEIIVSYSKEYLTQKNDLVGLSVLYNNREAVINGYYSKNLNLKLLVNNFVNQLATILKGNYISEQEQIKNWI